MKKIMVALALALACSQLSGCIVVPAGPVGYRPAPPAYYAAPVYYGDGYYHHGWR